MKTKSNFELTQELDETNLVLDSVMKEIDRLESKIKALEQTVLSMNDEVQALKQMVNSNQIAIRELGKEQKNLVRGKGTGVIKF